MKTKYKQKVCPVCKKKFFPTSPNQKTDKRECSEKRWREYFAKYRKDKADELSQKQHEYYLKRKAAKRGQRN